MKTILNPSNSKGTGTKNEIMLVNVSYNNKEIIQSIASEVGKPYRWKERWKMGGIGSPKLFISDASMEIMELLELDNKINSSNIEIRPRGIILRFRSILETFAVVIPFHKLAIFISWQHDLWFTPLLELVI